MFRSKTRNLIFPQSEHLRLSGTVSLHWGNEFFDKPDMDFHSYVAGAALHDWGHGFFDQNEIGAMDAEQRLRSMTNLVNSRLNDLIADTVMKHHVLRLMGNDPMYDTLRTTHLQAIDTNITKLGMTNKVFQRADRITNLTDMISFDFCFDQPIERSIPVYAQQNDQEQTDITYTIENGLITIDPWPLRVDSLDGYMLAFNSDGYPEQREPQVVTYHIQPLQGR